MNHPMKLLSALLLVCSQLLLIPKTEANSLLKRDSGYSIFHSFDTDFMAIVRSTPCVFTDDAAQQGSFSTGYIATFQTQANGTSVDITFELLDTDKTGIVAFLWQETPFAEFSMTDLGDNTFGVTMDGLTNGETVVYACKFAFAGGLAVTKYFEYQVGEVCEFDPMEDATLSDIKVDGVTIADFSPSQSYYKYETETADVPTVTATTTQTAATREITPAAAVPGSATILVTAEDGTTKKTYTIDFEKKKNYELVWSDEFDSDGTVNDANWHHQTIPIINAVDWANNEQQHYTDRADNSIVENGILKIIAKREIGYEQNGVAKNYTSARLNSKFAFTYGRVDVRAKLPAQLGTWPAIWTLGKNISETGAYWQTQGFGTTPWPATGEIDMMEQFGRNNSEKNDVHGSTHTPRSSGATENTARTTLNTSTTEYHVYSIIWDEKEIQFLVDDTEFYTYNPTEKYGGKITDPSRGDMNWPFDEPQFLILNVAMGGILGGPIPDSFTEGIMDIDYVRVYQEKEDETLTVADAIFTIDENSENGALVGSVATTYSGNEALTYSISSGNEDGVFQINATTGAITVADGSMIDFATQALYTLTVEVTDGTITEVATIIIEIDEPTVLSIDDELAPDAVMVYPNPVQTTLTLTFAKSSNIKINYVVDVLGREIKVPTVTGVDSFQLDFSKESPGIYVLRLENDKGHYYLRVQKY